MLFRDFSLIVGIFLCIQGPSVQCLQCIICDKVIVSGTQKFTNFSNTIYEHVPYTCRYKKPTQTASRMCLFELWISYAEGRIPTISVEFKSFFSLEVGEDNKMALRVESSFLNNAESSVKYTVYYTCDTDECNSFDRITAIINDVLLDFNPKKVLSQIGVPTHQQQYPLSCSNYTNITADEPECRQCEPFTKTLLKEEAKCSSCISISCENNQFCGSCYMEREPPIGDNYVIARLDYEEMNYLETKRRRTSSMLTCNTPNCNSLDTRKQVMSSFVLRYNVNDTLTTRSTTTMAGAATTSQETQYITTNKNSGSLLYSKTTACWIVVYCVLYSSRGMF